jgi:hypothetical protein
MAFTVSTFKSKLAAQSGGARPALYEVDINHFTGDSSFSTNQNILVKAASIPPATIAPLAVNYAGRAYKWNGFRTYDNWTVTVINDEDFAARNTMTNWMRFMSGKFDGKRTSLYGDPLVNKNWFDGDATVKQVSTSGSVVQVYKFHYLWPTEVAGIPVDWSSDAIQEYTITFAYDYWTHGSGPTNSTNVVS